MLKVKMTQLHFHVYDLLAVSSNGDRKMFEKEQSVNIPKLSF